MSKIKVQNMLSRRGTHNRVANQFQIFTPEGIYFQSYSTTIAFKDHNGKITLDTDSWDYSRTTATYRNRFLGMDTASIKRAINSGEITLKNLN